MTDSGKGIAVACTPNEVFVRVAGRGTFQNSQPLRRYALEMIDRGYRTFTIDIRECPTMDSTFLGVLAGIGLRLRRDESADPGKVKMVNVSTRNLELIQTLGLDRLFVVQPQNGATEPVFPAGVELQTLPESDADALSKPLCKTDTTSLMIQAHDNLVTADKRNESRFSQVTKFLRESLQRQPSSDTKKPK